MPVDSNTTRCHPGSVPTVPAREGAGCGYQVVVQERASIILDDGQDGSDTRRCALRGPGGGPGCRRWPLRSADGGAHDAYGRRIMTFLRVLCFPGGHVLDRTVRYHCGQPHGQSRPPFQSPRQPQPPDSETRRAVVVAVKRETASPTPALAVAATQFAPAAEISSPLGAEPQLHRLRLARRRQQQRVRAATAATPEAAATTWAAMATATAMKAATAPAVVASTA